ncbi:MAG: hypothetical protein D4S01_09530 [Dehalococcoidia bacterium]|nr:MAG: hypothetical protein D4S01_09530 [Dehalococcoidia bacterium]
MSKLDDLVDIEGYDDDMEMLEACGYDSVQPGICINVGCDYTAGVEPDCANGWCANCKTGTVQSMSVLLGII